MTPEGFVKQSCKDYLAIRNIFAWTNATTGIYDPSRKCFRKNPGLNGVSDILGILPDGRLLAVECKSKRGRLSPAQIEFLDNIRRNNGLSLCVHSVDDLIAALSAEGY